MKFVYQLANGTSNGLCFFLNIIVLIRSLNSRNDK